MSHETRFSGTTTYRDAENRSDSECDGSNRHPCPRHGLLRFTCPRCRALLDVGCHITIDDPHAAKASTTVHYGHPIDFIAEAPHLHAELWGHLVTCHQPDPHPYMYPESVRDHVWGGE